MRLCACSRPWLASLALFDEQGCLAGGLQGVFLGALVGLALVLLDELTGCFLDAKTPRNRDHAKAEIGTAAIRAVLVAIGRGTVETHRVTRPFFFAPRLSRGRGGNTGGAVESWMLGLRLCD